MSTTAALAVGDRVRPNFEQGRVTLGRVMEVLEPGSDRIVRAQRHEGGAVIVWDDLLGAVVWPRSSLIQCKRNDLRKLVAKFPGKCAGCNGRVQQREGVYYSPSAREIYHCGCA